jgi:hypothetical protein
MSVVMNSHLFVVDAGRWGLFTSGPSSGPGDTGPHELVSVHVDDMGTPLQFVRVISTSMQDGSRIDHVLVSAYPPFPAELLAEAVRRVSPVCHPAALALIVEDRTGWARASSPSRGAPEPIAAIVAYSKASGGWDDSVPIVVEVEDRIFNVSAAFKDGAWQMIVQRVTRT